MKNLRKFNFKLISKFSPQCNCQEISKGHFAFSHQVLLRLLAEFFMIPIEKLDTKVLGLQSLFTQYPGQDPGCDHVRN